MAVVGHFVTRKSLVRHSWSISKENCYYFSLASAIDFFDTKTLSKLFILSHYFIPHGGNLQA